MDHYRHLFTTDGSTIGNGGYLERLLYLCQCRGGAASKGWNFGRSDSDGAVAREWPGENLRFGSGVTKLVS